LDFAIWPKALVVSDCNCCLVTKGLPPKSSTRSHHTSRLKMSQLPPSQGNPHPRHLQFRHPPKWWVFRYSDCHEGGLAATDRSERGEKGPNIRGRLRSGQAELARLKFGADEAEIRTNRARLAPVVGAL
jgi:hypothetical protein